MSRPVRTRRGGPALLLAVVLSSVAACSSAPPPPSALENTDGAAPSSAPAAGPSASASALAVPITKTLADGTKVTTVVRNGQVIVTTTKNGKTTTTTKSATGTSSAPTRTTAARSTLFTPAEDKIGITSNSITMCAHAALTYGAAFNTSDADLNVFWSAVNDNGGVYGRKVAVTYENDDYKPTTAVEAARKCKAKGIFLLLGGIGFDQIPAVRNWAEENRMLYMHHTATVKGTAGQKFSFAPLPSVERTGEAFGQLYESKYHGKKIGIIKRDGENWEPGVVAFKSYIASHGDGKMVVAETAVPQNKGNYTDDVLAMKNNGAEVVWIWDNALDAAPIVKQIRAQAYNPHMMLFPFNLTAQTLDEDAFNPALDGVAMFTAYTNGEYGGPFASYADDMKLFEAQYKKYRPNVDLAGVGGDLLFLNWSAQKALYAQFLDCGKDCTRNRFVDMLETYNKRPTSSACPLDFTDGNHRRGTEDLVFMETYRDARGKAAWRNTKMCVGRG
ncbi:MAG: ABC transporter substrate-binding protein [Frankiaceae bacterium]|nr:ABC transporter substrate-binding protein [Frankiaceae bacterium]